VESCPAPYHRCVGADQPDHDAAEDKPNQEADTDTVSEYRTHRGTIFGKLRADWEVALRRALVALRSSVVTADPPVLPRGTG
jgi:hypothetical protein